MEPDRDWVTVNTDHSSYLPPQFIRLRILSEEYHLFHEPQVNLGKKNTFNVNHYLAYKNPLMLITTSSMSV